MENNQLDLLLEEDFSPVEVDGTVIVKDTPPKDYSGDPLSPDDSISIEEKRLHVLDGIKEACLQSDNTWEKFEQVLHQIQMEQVG